MFLFMSFRIFLFIVVLDSNSNLINSPVFSKPHLANMERHTPDKKYLEC